MKEYPSIPGSSGTQFRHIPNAYIFDKLDGSNIRVEVAKKGKEYKFKFGSRHRLLDETDKDLGEAIHLFYNVCKDKLLNVFEAQRWTMTTFFFEFYGLESFAGVHVVDDLKYLSLIDVCVYKQGIMGPADFWKTFKHLNFVCPLLSIENFNQHLIDDVRHGRFGCTFEGVVAKGGSGHKLVMAKAKTQAWLDKVYANYSREDAEKLI